jgi:hypothetical protein
MIYLHIGSSIAALILTYMLFSIIFYLGSLVYYYYSLYNLYLQDRLPIVKRVIGWGGELNTFPYYKKHKLGLSHILAVTTTLYYLYKPLYRWHADDDRIHFHFERIRDGAWGSFGQNIILQIGFCMGVLFLWPVPIIALIVLGIDKIIKKYLLRKHATLLLTSPDEDKRSLGKQSLGEKQ